MLRDEFPPNLSLPYIFCFFDVVLCILLKRGPIRFKSNLFFSVEYVVVGYLSYSLGSLARLGGRTVYQNHTPERWIPMLWR